MSSPGKKALVFGASGFVGSFLLQELLNDPDYGQVTIIVRKNLPITHKKLKQVKGDLKTITRIKDQLRGDDVFIALGTTKAKTPDEKEYYKIDHDYPVIAAEIAKHNGAKNVLVVSAAGADTSSSVFYSRTKGEMEKDIIVLGYEHTLIFRPSLLLGERREKRPLERVAIKIFRTINPLFLGKANIYKGIEGHDLARAMVQAAKNPKPKVSILYWPEMMALIKK